METKSKSLQDNSFVMDINMIEAPFFLFKNQKKVKKVSELKKDKTISTQVKKILDIVLPENENSPVEYIKWIDSKGVSREMFAMSMMALPNSFTMDVWYAIIALYIKKKSPVLYNVETKMYNLQDDKVEFTLYELAKFMNLNTGGTNLERIKVALLQLKSAQYYSFGEGCLYDKEHEKYIKSKLKGLSLISDIEIEGEKDTKGQKRSREKCIVYLGQLVMENIKREFIKYLSQDVYFKLPSGLSRRLYTYIEGNRYKKAGKLNPYIKRSFDVVGRKLPIEFKYNSEFKRRMNKPLENLVETGIIKDYFYGDEVLINGLKEQCIYIVFSGNKENIIEDLTIKYDSLITEQQEESKLEIPKDIKQELINLGIADEKASEIIQKYNKWTLIEYVLWINEKIKESNNSLKNAAGLLIYALQTQSVKLQLTHQYILDFVKEERAKIETKTLSDDEIKDKYEKYIENELNKFKKEDEFIYNFMKDNTIQNLYDNIDVKIAQFNTIIRNCKDEKDKKTLMNQIEELNEFKDIGEKSKLFKKHFIKEVSIMRSLKDFNTFKVGLLKGTK
ncbi:replication initiator protein A [Clostridium tarantellae]|uniref:Uncharacterized protein n=1 Tax=Clostridium tarantellae TaxID=39493 RepID=A0A6I1MHZ5_9CLOT|nr:replication initiator protein A [Clostridium tarantellae]MPQ43166.1 hypothetical protein [Clostridium tarantellae]